jgi:hypothetical protein
VAAGSSTRDNEIGGSVNPPKEKGGVLVVPTLAIMAIASATVALADNDVSVSIAPTVTLTAKVEVVTTITASCPSGWFTMGSQLTVEQATGREIAHGSTYIPGINCTGANQVIPVTVLADPTGPPFKNGTAVVTASFSAFYYGTTFGYGSATSTITVKLH